MIIDGTKAGIRAAKARGVVLGGPALPAINSARKRLLRAVQTLLHRNIAELARSSAHDSGGLNADDCKPTVRLVSSGRHYLRHRWGGEGKAA